MNMKVKRIAKKIAKCTFHGVKKIGKASLYGVGSTAVVATLPISTTTVAVTAGAITCGIVAGRAYQHHKDKKREYNKSSYYEETMQKQSDIIREMEEEFNKSNKQS